MSEEKDDTHVEDEILPTDEELSQALDEAFNGEPEPSPETEEAEEQGEPEPETDTEELDHGEKSRLGRKVAYLEERVATKDDLNDILRRLNDLAIGVAKPRETEEEHYEEELDIQTPEGLDKFLELRDRKKAESLRQEQVGYEKKYVSTLDTLLTDIPEKTVRDTVRSEMVKHGSQFNVRLSDDPSSDCARNFNKAFLHVTKNKKPDTVFDKSGRTVKVPSGVTGSSTTDKTAPVLKYELDEYEKAASRGMSIEEINSTLSEEIPLVLKGRRNVR
jgi:hypothetical protein